MMFFTAFAVFACCNVVGEALVIPKTLSAAASHIRLSTRTAWATSVSRMGIAAAADDAKVVICGPGGGLSAIIAKRLASAGGARRVELADAAESLASKLDGAKVIIIAADGGSSVDASTAARPGALVESVLASLSPATRYVFLVSSPPPAPVAATEGAKATEAASTPASPASILSSLFPARDADPLALVRSLPGATRAVVLYTGRLFGTAAGEEPVPFLTGPKAEPQLDESYTRQAVLVGAGTVLGNAPGARTKRLTVAEAIARFLELPERAVGVELSVISVEGPAPTAAEWEQEFTRLDDSRGVQVFALDMEAVPRRAALLQWLVDSWGPQLLRKVPAALISSGSRPVRVAATDEGAAVVWESVDAKLNVLTTGRLLVVVSEDGTGGAGAVTGIRVLRVDGSGTPRGAPLVGEEEVVQQLIEGLNQVVFPKGWASRKPLASAAMPAAATALRAKSPASAAVGAAMAGSSEVAADASSDSLRPGRGRRGARRRE